MDLSVSENAPGGNLRLTRGYGAAVVATAFAIWGRVQLEPWLGDQCEFSLFYLSVIATAWMAGTGPAVFAIVLSALAAAYFFIEPVSPFSLQQIPDLVQLAIFVTVNVITTMLLSRLQRQRRLAEQRSEENLKLSDSLQLADERKDEFLALLAHELRNPLAPILSSLSLLERQPEILDSARRFHNVIQRQSNHLIRLTDDLLDVSRFTRGKITLHQEVIDLRTAINDAVEMTEGLINEKSHVLHLVVPSEPIWVNGDRVRLAQSVANVLGNAAKYTPPAGRICLDVQSAADQVSIAVSDNGIGFSPSEAEKIVAPFAQVDGSRTREYGGLGLGLTIVSRLVALHGGSLETFSRGPGLGSRFTIVLATTAEAANVSDDQSEILTNEASTASELFTNDEYSSDNPKLKLLLVEDNPDASDLLVQLFQSEGCDVQSASNGMQALQLAGAKQYDVILLDIGLPGMDGYEVAKRLRGNHFQRCPRLIALTGWGSPVDQEMARQAGFDLHLVKPVKFRELLKHVQTLPPPSVEDVVSTAPSGCLVN